MKKIMSFGLAGLAVICLAAAPAFACGDDASGTKASAQTVSSSSSGTKTEQAGTASAHGTCAAKTDAKMTSTDKAVCADAHGGKLTSEECAKIMNMTAEECAKACGYTGEMKMVNMNIKGMTCGGCEKSVTAALEKVNGVVKVVSVNHVDGSALVCYDPTKVKTDVITAAVTNKGYPAEVVPAVATTGTDSHMKVCSPENKEACMAKQSKATTTGAEGTK